MKNNYKDLQARVNSWAEDKGILDLATGLSQIEKTREEVEETRDALLAKQNLQELYVNSKGIISVVEEEIEDGFGDILVTVLIGCKLQGLDPLECLRKAVEVIESRTGKMVNGTFVKDK